MRKIFVALMFFTAGYLMTGVVYESGDFGVDLVIKPKPSFILTFGGGEEGAWERHNPGQPVPWWQSKDIVTLLDGDWEGGDPLWLIAYFFGFYGLTLAWPIYLIVCLVRIFRQRRSASV